MGVIDEACLGLLVTEALLKVGIEEMCLGRLGDTVLIGTFTVVLGARVISLVAGTERPILGCWPEALPLVWFSTSPASTLLTGALGENEPGLCTVFGVLRLTSG